MKAAKTYVKIKLCTITTCKQFSVYSIVDLDSCVHHVCIEHTTLSPFTKEEPVNPLPPVYQWIPFLVQAALKTENRDSHRSHGNCAMSCSSVG